MRAALEVRPGATVVGEALDPASLIDMLRSTPCDVLVIDLSMPDPAGAVEDGLGLVRRIRRDWPALRVVVMTTLTNTEILRAVVSDNAISVLSKAESMDALWRAIEAGGDGQTYLGHAVVEALAQPVADEREALPPPRLSGLQAQIVRLFVDGCSISEIAVALGCHRRTVSRQKREAMMRLGVANDPGLFSYVRANKILNFESYS
ncbi:response regulator transcription factor [Paraburkholderia sp. BCC1884]|uniref:response regulator transcription factor n=1 Tax=Paraburkholderia sp. BCC1884 TaxID=2562668 RepID=UPI0021B362E2|nr:response regulator transcription factor [Paraburkholderia sp. BCC1884]